MPSANRISFLQPSHSLAVKVGYSGGSSSCCITPAPGSPGQRFSPFLLEKNLCNFTWPLFVSHRRRCWVLTLPHLVVSPLSLQSWTISPGHPPGVPVDRCSVTVAVHSHEQSMNSLWTVAVWCAFGKKGALGFSFLLSWSSFNIVLYLDGTCEKIAWLSCGRCKFFGF